MAETYAVVSQQSVVEFVPPDRTVNKHEVTARAEPSGIVFPVRVAQVDYTPSHLKIILGTIAEALNKLSRQPGVVGVDVEQDIGSGNQIVTSVVVTIESTSGASTADVRLSWGELFGVNGYPKLLAARKNLDAIEEI